ncbi:MAG: photosystem II stability/assembly factor-like protein [Bacteroidetes bacterium]|nr:photosystem II stability/assembly factor-like protein [Bacteroidota bacterium]
MKTKQSCLTLFTIILFFLAGTQIGCNKDNDEPEPGKEQVAWAVGAADSTNYGMILFSSDGGDNWVRQGEGNAALTGIYLNDVWVVDENTAWVIGSENTILKTTDKGQTWTQLNTPQQPPEVELVSISMVDSDNIWVSGSYGTVYNSTDGGNTWTKIQNDVLQNKYIQGIHAMNADVIYCVGGYEGGNTNGFIARTTDGGQNWDSIVPIDNFNQHLWIGITSSGNKHIVYGQEAHYIVSDDGGQTWRNDSVPGTGGTNGADINCLKMLDATTWWGAFDYDEILRTDNSGEYWETQGPAPGPQNMWLLGLDYYNKDLCIIVGSSASSNNGKIIKTGNGGQSWELKLETDAWMQKVSFIK